MVHIFERNHTPCPSGLGVTPCCKDELSELKFL